MENQEKRTAENITVAELDQLCEQLAQKELEKEKAEEALKEINKDIGQLENRCSQFLADLEREKYDSPFGKGVINEKWRVNLPKTDEDKLALFAHLKERGIFERFATVNSNSLNSLFKADWEAAKEEGRGMEFTMPGIGAPNVYKQFDFKIDKDWKKKHAEPGA